MSVLRDYQRAAVAAFWDTLATEDVNRVAIEMATGLGKTVTMAGAVDEFLASARPVREKGARTPLDMNRSRVLVLVHTDELVRQTVAKLRAVVDKRLTIGVVKADRNEVDADIVVASVQTLARPGRREQITDVGLIVVDECHHAVAVSYLAILEHFGAFGGSYVNRDVRPRAFRPTPVLGLTATLARSDGQSLGQVWQALPFTRSLSWGIRKGFLIDLEPWTITVPDITLAEDAVTLDSQMAESIAPELVVDAWLDRVILSNVDVDSDSDLYKPYPSTVLFAPLVASAQRFADAFNAEGIKAEVISDKVPLTERRAILDRYESGVTTVICNAMVLTEGWDSPRTMCVIVARPTKSVPLFIQMVGRGLRPWLEAEAPAREDQRCILLTIADGVTPLATHVDLSDRPLEPGQDGRTLTQLEDEWDLGRDLEPDQVLEYRGPVRVERWDALVQASSKAWKYTDGGTPFLPTAKRSEGYVFITEQEADQWHEHAWKVWLRRPASPGEGRGAFRTTMLAVAPDLELAMALAEDAAQEHGGDIGALLADKSRAWRKAVPSAAMQEQAQRLGINLIPIMESRAGGKAGKLSDLIDKVQASRILDPVVTKIKARSEA